MTDALCGPSNPLQSFQKHTQVDRTLQQDRLVSRQSPSQGFRSTTPNAGVLDPEFEAFQAGLPVGPSLLDDTPIHPLLPTHAPHFLPQSSSFAPSGWANDFQRSITPSLQAQPYHAPLTQHNPVPSWHSDFLRTQTPTFAAPQPTFQPTYNPMNNFSMGYTPQFSSVAQGKQKASEPVVEDPFNMAAFERAFDAAHRDIMEAEEQAAQAIRELQEETNRMASREANSMEQDILLESKVSQWPDSIVAEHERSLFEENALEQEPVHEDKQQQERKLDDDDDLSRVAGQLLDSVSHENSQKFQDSVFLQLMRKLRDKEVKVDGENFVETSIHAEAFDVINEYPPSTQQQHDPNNNTASAGDADLGRYGIMSFPAEDVASPDTKYQPSRPLTPEIDPPAPTLAQWRRRYDFAPNTDTIYHEIPNPDIDM